MPKPSNENAMKKKKNDASVKYGRAGGNKTLEKYGKDHYSRIAKKRHAQRRQAERRS